MCTKENDCLKQISMVSSHLRRVFLSQKFIEKFYSSRARKKCAFSESTYSKFNYMFGTLRLHESLNQYCRTFKLHSHTCTQKHTLARIHWSNLSVFFSLLQRHAPTARFHKLLLIVNFRFWVIWFWISFVVLPFDLLSLCVQLIFIFRERSYFGKYFSIQINDFEWQINYNIYWMFIKMVIRK